MKMTLLERVLKSRLVADFRWWDNPDRTPSSPEEVNEVAKFVDKLVKRLDELEKEVEVLKHRPVYDPYQPDKVFQVPPENLPNNRTFIWDKDMTMIATDMSDKEKTDWVNTTKPINVEVYGYQPNGDTLDVNNPPQGDPPKEE